MPHGTEQRKRRADLKSQVLSLLLVFGIAGPASASTGHTICQSDNCATRFKVVDYSVASKDAGKMDKTLKDREALKKSSMALTSKKDSTVRRDQFLKSDVELPAFDRDSSDPVARLLERRSLEKDREPEADAETPAMKSALPGLDAESLRLFREKMYRTDI